MMVYQPPSIFETMSTALRNQHLENLDSLDPFRPSWIYRNGHVQTLASMYVYSPWARSQLCTSCTSTAGEILLSDGDRLVYHDDCPSGWKAGDRVALLLHGLSGSHASPYMSRIGGLINQRNLRTFRLDWRGCGAGIALARYPYHSGCSNDLLATIAEIKIRCPGSPMTVIGFSLGGNVTLKLLGEARDSADADRLAAVDRAIAVCPPIDLSTTVKSLCQGWTQLYDRYFCNACIRDVRNRQQLRPDAVVPDGWFSRPPRSLYEFDDTFTAPVSAFESAADYYTKSSSNQFLTSIRIPTLIIAAQDDPVLPFGQFEAADYSSTTILLAPRHGGHMGFCTARGLGWLDRHVVEWTIGK
jgi:predicted alpha/beta-fold hydrolase